MKKQESVELGWRQNLNFKAQLVLAAASQQAGPSGPVGMHVRAQSLSRVRLFATPGTVARHGILQAKILEWVA